MWKWMERVATVLVIAAAGAVIWSIVGQRVEPQGRTDRTPVQITIPKEPISLSGSLRKGDSAAPLVLVEYSEFQCPFCARFATETLPILNEKYVLPGRMQIEFRHLPLEAMHKDA